MFCIIVLYHTGAGADLGSGKGAMPPKTPEVALCPMHYSLQVKRVSACSWRCVGHKADAACEHNKNFQKSEIVKRTFFTWLPKCFQLEGLRPPDLLTRALPLWTPLGLSPETPNIASRSRYTALTMPPFPASGSASVQGRRTYTAGTVNSVPLLKVARNPLPHFCRPSAAAGIISYRPYWT